MSRRNLKPKNPNGLNGPMSGDLNSLGSLGATGQESMNLFVEFVVTPAPQVTEQGSDVGDTIREVHAASISPFRGDATQNSDAPNSGDRPQNWAMDKWIQLPAFVKRVEEYQDKTGKTHTQVALELGASVSTLRNWLYGQKVPGFKKKQRAAALFGCDVNEFIDNAAAERPTSVDLTAYSEIDRYRFDQVIKTLSDPALTDDDRQMLFEDLKSRAIWVLSLKSKKF